MPDNVYQRDRVCTDNDTFLKSPAFSGANAIS